MDQQQKQQCSKSQFDECVLVRALRMWLVSRITFSFSNLFVLMSLKAEPKLKVNSILSPGRVSINRQQKESVTFSTSVILFDQITRINSHYYNYIYVSQFAKQICVTWILIAINNSLRWLYMLIFPFECAFCFRKICSSQIPNFRNGIRFACIRNWHKFALSDFEIQLFFNHFVILIQSSSFSVCKRNFST